MFVSEMLTAEDRQGGPVPFFHLLGHETLLLVGEKHALGTCRWSGTHCDACLTLLCMLLTPQRGHRKGGTAGQHISGQAEPANMGQPQG